MTDQFCFCTLAVGSRYRAHAHLLAKDIQTHSPNTSFVVLTDEPDEFRAYSHVLPLKHILRSVKGYHDKRFVIEKALEHSDACMYLDSDVRILGPVPTTMEWSPGITARTGCNILKHNTQDNQRGEFSIIQKVANKLGIELTETAWFHEFMFTVKKKAGAEVEFLKTWQTISYFFELNGYYDGEGNVMGLAAAKSGLPIQFDSSDRFPFFKDNIEKIRIKHGQSNQDEKQIYFDIHREIEYPKRSTWKKILRKIIGRIIFGYRWLRLRYFVVQDSSFSELA
ncbi:MAG: hypothetical protein F6K16_31505 [Symploca sp. SIO2B6]|nr:hypothetical protein [Symploca sp. SIO2B6]